MAIVKLSVHPVFAIRAAAHPRAARADRRHPPARRRADRDGVHGHATPPCMSDGGAQQLRRLQRLAVAHQDDGAARRPLPRPAEQRQRLERRVRREAPRRRGPVRAACNVPPSPGCGVPTCCRHRSSPTRRRMKRRPARCCCPADRRRWSECPDDPRLHRTTPRAAGHPRAAGSNTDPSQGSSPQSRPPSPRTRQAGVPRPQTQEFSSRPPPRKRESL